MVVVIRHGSHRFPRDTHQGVIGACEQCSIDPNSFAASLPCRIAADGPPPKRLSFVCHCGAAFPSLQALGAHRGGCVLLLCTVCDEPIGARRLRDVQIRQGGPVERMCPACIAWLRDELDTMLRGNA